MQLVHAFDDLTRKMSHSQDSLKILAERIFLSQELRILA